MKKYLGKYRTESNRKPGWNYASNALYFITIVTQNRECNLGKIIDSEMIMSAFGEIVNTEWYKSFEMRDELFLEAYIIMPNHLHAVVEIKNIETIEMDNAPYIGDSKLYRIPKSISSFIAGFKSSVNSKIDDYIDEHQLNIPKYNRNNHFFQANYHDHIIRNQQSHQNIVNYILTNPSKWTDDKFKL